MGGGRKAILKKEHPTSKHVWKPRIIAKSLVVTDLINSKEEKWHCDCGCSQHMINNKNALIDLYYIKMDRVIPDNGAVLAIYVRLDLSPI